MSGTDERVTHYKLERSFDDISWIAIARADGSYIWDGNVQGIQRVDNHFPAPIDAQFVRLYVLGEGGITAALSWGLIGCPNSLIGK